MLIRVLCSVAFLIPSVGLTQPIAPTTAETTQNSTAKKSFPKLEVKITLKGNAKPELSKQLQNEIALTHLERDEFPAQTDFLFKRAEQEILDVLRALGYYEPKITHSLQRNGKQTLASFQIDLGKPVKTRKVDIVINGEGKNLASWKQYKKFKLTLRPKTQFRHEDYSDTINALKNLAINEGHMDAEFTQREFKVYPHLHAVDVHIHLDTKQSYQFGKVSFQGNKTINSGFLSRYAEFKEGDTYQYAGITALQKSLIDSRFFGLIRVIPQYSEQVDRKIPINVELEESLKHHYDMGIGYGTDTGARVLFGFENRLVNQYGHSYQVDSLFGERAQNFNFNYHIPGERPAVQYWNAGVGYEATQSDTLEKSLTSISGDYNYQITPLWLIKPFVSLETESFRYKYEPSEEINTLLVGINATTRWVNNESYPTSGYRHSATLRASMDGLVSESQFAQLELSSQAIFSIQEFWRLHANAKTIVTASDKNQVIPASYRYLLGGETLRGYEFESVGLINEDGATVGARNLILGSLETDYRLTEYFGLGLFADAGQLFDFDDSTDLKVGAGFGLRGYTPVGMAKLDIAWPVSEEGEQPWRIHFSLGFDL
ncbi:autotransporter assembly complex family protein [Thiomicrorhabdus sp. Kp2]|uniref:autotransporter assembly complex protein TamA n=1 Tax=Thiomicrorhabdus sp. Kp2 TaxID=1123518 RepID=UPI00042909F9|nr:BamA/TamA family outer membrane protein [Thiomicrorhabdus sp. Kp2]